MRIVSLSVGLGLATLCTLTILACGDDDSTPGNVSPGPDGSTNPNDGGTTPGPDGSSTQDSGSIVEPTCDPLSGAPSWTFKGPAIPDWSANPDQDPLGPKIVGLSGIAHGNGVWVVMAASQDMDHLTWATSTDAVTWTPHTQALTNTKVLNLRHVHYDTVGKRFIFFAQHAQVGMFAYQSSDGMTWTSSLVSNSAANVSEFDTSGTMTVVAGANGAMFTSPDLITWTPRSLTGAGYLDVVYGGGRFLASSNGAGTVYTSPDGVTWTPIDGLPTGFSYGRGAFFGRGGGKFVKSTDGVKFDNVTMTGTGLGVTSGQEATYAGGRFILTSIDFTKATSTFGVSTDGVTWSDFGAEPVGLTATPAGAVFPLEIAYGGCHYIAAGNYRTPQNVTTPYMVIGAAPPAP